MDAPALERHLLPLVRQQAREVESLTRQLASLQTSLEERKLIERAKSLLITHQQLSEEEAWHQLRKLAMDQNKRMVEIAEAMLAVARLWPVTRKE
ncbi:Response regulator NasT [Cronobacter muytjensii 530]